MKSTKKEVLQDLIKSKPSPIVQVMKNKIQKKPNQLKDKL